MASERQRTKDLVRNAREDEPELDEAFSAAKNSLEITRENNRHKEALQNREIGRLGELLGGPNQAPLSVAAVVAFVALVGSLGCVAAIFVYPAASAAIERPLSLLLGLVATTLAYIFGARSNRVK